MWTDRNMCLGSVRRHAKDMHVCRTLCAITGVIQSPTRTHTHPARTPGLLCEGEGAKAVLLAAGPVNTQTRTPSARTHSTCHRPAV